MFAICVTSYFRKVIVVIETNTYSKPDGRMAIFCHFFWRLLRFLRQSLPPLSYIFVDLWHKQVFQMFSDNCVALMFVKWEALYIHSPVTRTCGPVRTWRLLLAFFFFVMRSMLAGVCFASDSGLWIVLDRWKTTFKKSRLLLRLLLRPSVVFHPPMD